VVTALNQSATVFLTYFASRRFLGSRRQALLAVLLLFLGMRSLLEVFGNNNSFVYLFLFLNAYLYLVALVQRSLGPKIVSFVSLATYAIVYETHYGILLVVFSLSCLILTFARPRYQPRYVLIAALVLGASLVVALVQGGTLSDLGRRQVLSSPQEQGALKDLAQINQEVTIRFPKPRLIVTSFDGTEYPLISLRLLREAGYFVVFLPAVAIVMLLTRRIWGLFVTGMAIVALAIPTTVDFGTYNAESYRFLFFGGIAAAMSLGITVGVGLDRLEEHGHLSFRIRVVVLCLLLLACSGSIFRTAGNLAHVARRPQEYFWYAEEWACQGMYRRLCDPMDITTAIKIRPMIRSGNVIMTNVSTGNPPDPLLRTAHSVIAAFAGAFVGGHGILISQDRLFKMGREYTEPEGFRAIAFWNTGEPELLDDLHVDYLLIDPDKTLPSVLQKVKQDTRFQLVHRETDVWRGEREVYRVSTKTPASPLQTPADLSLEQIEVPTSVQRASFHPLSLEVATRDSAFTGSLRIGYRAFYKDLLVNATDEIRHLVHFTRTGRGTWVGNLFFVAPYESGVYTVDVYSADTGKPLLRRDGSPAAFEVAVSD
jgi:hypothetical protein